ncbi:unnamed protein product [Effrenium voratum]|nr:unnamed protein product [Effrenium voratum]
MESRTSFNSNSSRVQSVSSYGEEGRSNGVSELSTRDSKIAIRLTSKEIKTEAIRPPLRWYVRCSACLVENTIFISFTTVLTIYALTGDDLRVLMTEKPADLYFNVLVLVCIAIFSFEILISVMGKSDYFLGFFFVLDFISTITLVLDLTWVNDALAGGGSDSGSDSSSLRSGRTARVGAKAARMIRVLRLVRILKLYKALYEADRERLRRRQREREAKDKKANDDEWDEEDAETVVDAEMNATTGQESTLGKKLSEMTTRRVIILILAMLLVLPLLSVDDIQQSPFSAEYGANQVSESFKDYDASGQAVDQQQYYSSLLTYVYYHNWYAGKAAVNPYCPYQDIPSCANGFWGHLYFVGIGGTNSVLVDSKAAKAKVNLTSVLDFNQRSQAEPQAIYNLGVLPGRAQELLAGEWATSCNYADSLLKGVSLISEDVDGAVSYPAACPQDLRVTDSLAYSPVWQTRHSWQEWRFVFYFDVRPFNRETAIFSLATTGVVLVLLLTGSLMFSRDANRLIVSPVEQMIRRVKEIRDNPLIAMKMADDEFKLEELKKFRLRNQGCLTRAFNALISCRCWGVWARPGPAWPTRVGGDRSAMSEDDLPPLLGEDGEELEPAVPAPATASPPAAEPATEPAVARRGPALEEISDDEAEVAERLRTEAAKRAGAEAEVSASDAMAAALKEAEEEKVAFKEPDERTKRMIQAIAKDDFEECEDAIMQGADVSADCGAGMCALHISALRGEMFLTELLLAHGARVNQRDLSGNTPLLYACHFYRQHGKGVQLCAQLLFHKADPHYRVKDGKMAGQSALDLMEKACNEPNTDENVPRQMRAMLQLALDGSETSLEAITKMWVSIKSQPPNKKLFQVSSRRDNFEYSMKSISWELPADAKNSQGYAPQKLEVESASLLEEKFTILSDYLFNDEGDKVKVYVTFPESAAAALSQKQALEVSFEYQAFDLKLRAPAESFRLRLEPLYGSIEVNECKHRASPGSRKVTLTLVKRHKNRTWSALQKAR